jgi:hypothetical protein
MASTCNTTPGAECKIVFTKNTETHELSSKTADAGGATYWNWKPQEIGLSPGEWRIDAVASLNGESITRSDALSLTVR